MSKSPREPVWGLALTWIACGVTTIGLAFTISPVRASRDVFWAVVGTGVALLLVGCVLLVRRWLLRPRGSSSLDARHLLAGDCRRLHDVLTAFVNERDRPRPWLWMSQGRLETWNDDTTARYRADLSDWAIRVFDAAMAFGAVPPTARDLVQSPAPSQLGAVRDLFGEAAQTLERR